MKYKFLFSAVASTLLFDILPVHANSELMRSVRYIPVCNFTTLQDYESLTNWDSGISTSNIFAISSDFRQLNDKECYIYLTPGSPGKFVTAHKSELDHSKILLRLSTESEISFALNNLAFLQITKGGLFRAKFEETKKQ
jgi:hypothetical protein